MKTDLNSPRSFDDLLFENRNHDYGAYVIRKAYHDNVNKGTMLAIGAAAIIAIVSILPKEVVPSKITAIRPDPVIDLSKWDIVPLPPPPPAPSHHIQARPDLPPVAVANDVPDLPLPPVEENIAGSDQGVAMGDPNASTFIEAIPDEIGPSVPVVEDRTFDHSEVMPEYVGGLEAMMRFIVRNVKYPNRPLRMEREGTVFVSFVVGKDGAVLDPRVVKGFDPDCDMEAIRVITKMAKWNPGLQSGVPVKVRMVVPIRFKLSH